MTSKTDRGWLCPHLGHSTGECGPQCACTERIRNGTYGVPERVTGNGLLCGATKTDMCVKPSGHEGLCSYHDTQTELKEVRGLVAKLSADNQQLRVVIRQLQAHIAQAIDDFHRILR